MQKLILVIFLLALLVTGMLGTETRLLFFWPGSLLLGVAGLLAAVRWRLRVSFPPNDLCLLTTLLFALYIASRAWFSPVQDWAREDFFTLCGALVAYLLTATAASHPQWRMGIVYVLLALTAGNLAVGMIHFSGRWDFHLVPGFARSFQSGRIGGFFNNPNHLAAFLSMVMFLCAGWMLFGRAGTTLRLLLGFGVLTIATGTALTISRGALIGVGAGAVVFMLLALALMWKTRRDLFKWLLLGGSVLLLLAAAILYKVNEEAISKREAGSPITADIRERIWSSAMTQHLEAPFLGAGSRVFYSGSIQHRDPRMQGWEGDALFAHNEYLQMLADYGWAGLLLLLVMIAAHAWNGVAFVRWFAAVKFQRTGSLSSTTLALALGSLAALAATLVHAVVEFHWHIPAVAVTGAVLLGFLANPGFDADAPRRAKLPPVRTAIKLAALAASAALAFGAASWGAADYHAGMAMLAAKKKDHATALERLLRAGDVDPGSATILYQRGLAYFDNWSPKKSQPEQKRLIAAALADLQRACELNPLSHHYQLALADALDASGKHDEAMQAVQRALKLAPLHEEPRVALGKHFHNLRQFEKAEAAYLWARTATAMNPAGTANWRSYYEQMLRDTAFLAERTAAKP
ncbi:MAG: O-antigen ligase family protein [Verrucomicrobiaceae bacterium]|nr:O-antigen ligase family protein [Verrucomicrobiaceae bacterium]